MAKILPFQKIYKKFYYLLNRQLLDGHNQILSF